MKTSKPTLGIVVFFIAVFTISSCKKDDALPEPPSNPMAAIDPESQKIITHLTDAYGFERTSIEEYPDEFIADGDISFPKANFWEHYVPNPEETYKHYRFTNLVTAVSVIPVRIASNVPSSWKTAYINAISKWNSLNGRVTFYYCNPAYTNYASCIQYPYGVNVSYGYLGTGYPTTTIAITQYPLSNGVPGTFSKINSGLAGTLTSSQKLFAAIHELGHAIGIRHTDRGEGSLINTSISTCNIYTDPASVMRPYVGSFSVFTTCDIAAFRRLYPNPS